MEKNIIAVSPVNISLDSLLSVLHVDEENDLIEDIKIMFEAAIEIARPIAIYVPLSPGLCDGTIELYGVKLEEPFVYEMLSNCNIVIPYVISCGQEIDLWSQSFTDVFEQFVADELKQLCLNVIREKLFSEVHEKYFKTEGKISHINPGSLKEWPITGQTALFNILGGVTSDIGVRLLDSLLMSPGRSVSGIMFQAEQTFHNCQLCPKIDCPNRRVPYTGD